MIIYTAALHIPTGRFYVIPNGIKFRNRPYYYSNRPGSNRRKLSDKASPARRERLA